MLGGKDTRAQAARKDMLGDTIGPGPFIRQPATSATPVALVA